MARIDIIFVTTDWEAVFPLARVKALERPHSDHNPLLLNTGDNVQFGKKYSDLRNGGQGKIILDR
jgi:hypothetical protein